MTKKQTPVAQRAAISEAARLFRAGRYAQAEAHTKKALKSFPKSHELYEVLGLSLAQQNKMEPALFAFTAVHKLGKGNYGVYCNIAKVNFELGRYETCHRVLKQLRKQNPNDHSTTLMLGDLMRKQGRLSVALDLYKEALGASKYAAEARRGRAGILKIMMDEAASLEETRQAIALAPTGAFGPSYLLTYPIGMLSDADIELAQALLENEASKRTPLSKKIHMEGLIDLHRGNLKSAAEKILSANKRKLKELEGTASSRQQFEKASQSIQKLNPPQVDVPPESPKLLLIVGPSTSGKSTLEAMLITSPKAIPRYEAFNQEIRKGDKPEQNQSFDPDILKSLFFLGPEDEPLDYKIVVNTLPSIIFRIDQLIESVPTLHVVYIVKDKLRLTVDILTKYYNSGNFYAYDTKHTQDYIEDYQAYMGHVSRVLGDRFLEIQQSDISDDPQGTIARVEQMLGQSLDIDAEAARPKVYPQAEGYYDTMADLLGVPRED